ncbi:hypothetical protein BGZ60DRAFT_1271 [Tricladium varicosporioides]|nr:hypothetical protein BGZ60DRAFT_1271 [Hymenoscyphus varicosporioides]
MNRTISPFHFMILVVLFLKFQSDDSPRLRPRPRTASTTISHNARRYHCILTPKLLEIQIPSLQFLNFFPTGHNITARHDTVLIRRLVNRRVEQAKQVLILPCLLRWKDHRSI